METRKIPRWFMHNTSGKPDAMLTLTFISFVITTFVYFTSCIGTITIGSITVTFVPFNPGYAGVVLIPLLMAYFGRRYTTASLETLLTRVQTPVINNHSSADDIDVPHDEDVLR